jgi:membrane peptidoglycan carboxypeptidase
MGVPWYRPLRGILAGNAMRTMSPPSHRARTRPITDRWAYKPVAFLLLVPVILAGAGLTAVVLAPPFLGMGLGVHQLDQRLQAAGANFTRIPPIPQRSTIYANDGKTVLARVYLDNREIVPLHEISPLAREAVLAIEDSGFYEHGALNLPSMFRALAQNIRAHEVVQGGSTITQQLVKLTLGLDPLDRSFGRKFQELALAMRVEQKYSKDRILEMYLNQVYLGNNVYGIATAAEFYFHTRASKLDLPQAALLAGLIRAPLYYDPLARPRKARLRRNDVLNAMIRLGPTNGGISARSGARAKATPLELAPNVGQFHLPTPPFIVDYVKQQIHDDPHGWYSFLGATPDARDKALAEGGYDIITTLDPSWQHDAQQAADAPWAATPQHPEYKPPVDLGIVSLDVGTGAIRTMLSGKHYQKDKTNTVTTPHQPGSSFKPYVLAAAFEQGIPPTAVYSGVQGVIADPRCETNGVPWTVINAEGTSLGSMNLYQATADSVNAVFARLILDVGPDNVAEMARRMGVTSPLPPVCSLATGSVGITPLDQASGYQTLANGGVHCTPFAVAEIRRGDQILYRQRPDCTRVLAEPIAALETDVLKGPVTTGTAASVFGGSLGKWPLAGKTGTADSNTDVWFAGYTRQVVTAVWVGSQGDPKDSSGASNLTQYFGYDVFGATLAAPIFKAYMLQVMAGYAAEDFPAGALGTVPSVVGKTLDEARLLIRTAHFRLSVHVIGSYLPSGTVVQQDPAAGTQTVPKAIVTVWVSNGVAPIVTLPNVIGSTLDAARSALGALHLVVNVVQQPVGLAKNDGIVLSTDPAGGSKVKEGSSVTVVVGVFTGPSSSPSPPGNGNGNGNGGGGGGH